MKKVFIIVILLVVTGLLLYVFLKKPNRSYNPVSAIPKNAAVIVKVKGLVKLTSSLSDNNFYQNAITDSLKNELASLKFSLDSFIHENSSIKKVLVDSSIYFSFHINKNNSNGINTYLPFGTLTDFDVVAARIYFFLKKRGIDLYKYNPLETKIERLNTVYYFTEKGIFVLGNNLQNVKEAYVQTKTSENLYNDTSFSKVFNTSGKNVSSCIYLNMSKIQYYLKDVLKTEFNKYVNTALNSKGWTALDMNIDLNYISFHGFSDIKPQNQIWIKLLKNELPASNSIVSVLPLSATYFGLISANDFYNYKIAFREKVKKDPELSHCLKNIRSAFGENIDDRLFDVTSGTVASFLSCNLGNDCNRFCVITTKNSIEPLVFINSLRKNRSTNNKHSQIQTEDSLSVKSVFLKLPGKNLTSLYGDLFQNNNYQYITNYKNYLIFGESELSLRNYIDEINNNKTILQDSLFRQALSGAIASKSNFTFYFNISRVKDLVFNFISQKNQKYINRNIFDKTSKSLVGMQLSGSGNYIYNNLYFYSEPTLTPGPELVWSVKLDTNPETAPTILNRGKNQFYFVQDKKFNIYLISASGNVLWKKAIGEKILSKIFKIDYNSNNSEHIVFNTSEKLYIINFEGEDSKGFPLKFKVKASNGLTVADFDENKNYRFYIAFEDKKFAALNKSGKSVEGWKFEKTKGIVTKPAQCFSFKQKDYIVFSDSSKVYLLNRKGVNQLKVKELQDLSINSDIYIELRNAFFRLVLADKKGNVNGIYPDGHVNVTSFNLAFPGQYFNYYDINKDRTPEYILADTANIYVYNFEKKSVFSIHTQSNLKQKPIIILDKEEKNFIAYSAGEKVYLTDAAGKLIKGFPINGNFPVNVISLSDVSYSFAIFTSSEDKINCYYVH